MKTEKRIKVLVVDDSALMRKLLTKMLDSIQDLEVVGTAMDGKFALSKVEALKPDVVTLDLDMPRMDGLTALKEIVERFSLPVVLVSSGAVYGDQGDQPLDEGSPPNPHSPYAVSKLSAEYYVRTIGDLWAIETVSLRVFNAYGPGQHIPPSHPPVIPNFIHQAVRGGTLVVHSDGNQTRDYVFVDDVVNAMVAAATAQKVNRLLINVGSGEETSVRELANMVLDVTKSNPEMIYNPRTDPGVSRMCADLTLARESLGYRPRISLAEGLRLTLERDPRFRNEATRPVRNPPRT